MKRHSFFSFVAMGFVAPSIVMLSLVGCGSGKKPTTAEGKGTATAQAGADDENTLTITEESTPDIVVSGFLEALRSGDKDSTAALLTTKAREETTKNNISVDPTSSPDSMYEVAEPKYLADNPKGAHVDSVWHEKLEDGSDASYTITWVLRKESNGWRVAGMALEIIPGEEPRFLNFEDPEDMLKKREEAIAAAQKAMAETANAATDGTTAAAAGTEGAAMEAEGTEVAPASNNETPSSGESEPATLDAESTESAIPAKPAPTAPARPSSNKLRSR